MYDKIAQTMNESFGASDMDAGLVENYLRNGKSDFISADEEILMEVLLERYI